MGLLEKLETSLSEGVRHLLSAIVKAQPCHENNGLYVVGGVIRDLILEIPHADMDFVVEGDTLALVQQLQSLYGGSLKYHPQFKTAQWILDAQIAERFSLSEADLQGFNFSIDFATARTEYYPESGALPIVEPSLIEQDLHRRDFTINALALQLCPEPRGKFLDFYNGEADLKAGMIRILHNRSFIDDPTRILRAVRYEQRLNFHIESYTLQRLYEALPALAHVSGDRIRHELNLILAEKNALLGIKRLSELGILPAIHPALNVDEWVLEKAQELQSWRQNPRWKLPPDFNDWRVAHFSLLILRLTADEINSICERLSISRVNTKHLQAVHAGYQKAIGFTAETPMSEMVAILEPLGMVAWLSIYVATEEFQRDCVFNFVTHWQHIRPSYDGKRLQQMQIPAGPHYKIILEELRAAWLDGKITSFDEETVLLNKLLQQYLPNIERNIPEN